MEFLNKQFNSKTIRLQSDLKNHEAVLRENSSLKEENRRLRARLSEGLNLDDSEFYRREGEVSTFPSPPQKVPGRIVPRLGRPKGRGRARGRGRTRGRRGRGERRRMPN